MDLAADGAEQDGATPSAGFPVDSQIMLGEYTALRAEIDRRAQVQWNVFALQVTSAGAVASLAIASASRFTLLLIIPLSSYMLGSRYILHDFHIKLIQRYIRESLSPRLRGRLQWEGWKKQEFWDAPDRRWSRATGWTVAHPTRLAFEGVAALALVAAALLAVYRWVVASSSLALMTGFTLMWILGASLTYVLHRSFNHSSNA